MRREGPVAAGENGGVADDRCRRVEIMDVQMANVVAKLPRQGERLSEPPDAIGARITHEVAKEQAQQSSEPRTPRAPGEPAPDAQRFLIEVFGEVAHARPDPLVHRVHEPLGRMAKGPDLERDAAVFERQHFLRDEGLGQPRIAFDHDGDPPAGASCRHEPAIRPPDESGGRSGPCRARRRSGRG
jgi:hypothetical protein